VGTDLDDLDDDFYLDDPYWDLEEEEEGEDDDDDDDDDDEGELCRSSSKAEDPFYDRSPLFSVLGRLVRFQENAGKGN